MRVSIGFGLILVRDAYLDGDGEAFRHVAIFCGACGPCGRGLGAFFCDGVGDRNETGRAQR